MIGRLRRSGGLMVMMAAMALCAAGARAGDEKPAADAAREGAPVRQESGALPEGVRRAMHKVFEGEIVRLEDGAVILRSSDGKREVAVPTDADTQVSYNGQKIQLSELQPGMMARIVQDEGLTRQIDARNARGAVGGLGGAGHSISVMTRVVNGQKQTIIIEDGKVIRREGFGDRPNDPPAADGPRGNQPEDGRRVLRGGFVKLDGADLVIQAGPNDPKSAIPTNEKTQVLVDGQPAKLVNIQPGDRIVVKMQDGVATTVEVTRAPAPLPAER